MSKHEKSRGCIIRPVVLISILSTVLVACGGSSGANQTPTPPPPAQLAVSLEFLPSIGQDMIVRVRITTVSNSVPDVNALVLSDKLVGIGQPEVVPGLVNTRGVEDSPEVSADGQWLTVGAYIPLDFGHCIVKGRGATEPAC